MTLILDCYTDEPSGYGVRPFLGTHQIHLSQALEFAGVSHAYLTIEDLRYASGLFSKTDDANIHTLNRTNNAEESLELLHRADIIYLIMGCFVEYQYFSCIPPKSEEVFKYLEYTKARKILFYVMGTKDGISDEYQNSKLKGIISDEEHGNTYRYILEKYGSDAEDFLAPNYQLLSKISSVPAPIIEQLKYPIIAEIETGTGCNTPFCHFCIESVRAPKVTYREPNDIITQVSTLYRQGVRHFRLGRQPNFYHFHQQNIDKMNALLSGIRDRCPEIETLHIDNVNMINVLGKAGGQITELIVKYCTSGNIAPFGIESFDMKVRKANGIVGSPHQVMKAIEVINKHGQVKGPDGYPKFLPGINLIHNLNGHTDKTHDTNLTFLKSILDNGLQTRRLYYRSMTRPTGVTFEGNTNNSSNYEQCFRDIVDSYVMPMQDILYPPGSCIIRNAREVVVKDNNSYLRTLGTCPIRILVENNKLTPYSTYNIRITENVSYRLIKGEVLENP